MQLHATVGTPQELIDMNELLASIADSLASIADSLAVIAVAHAPDADESDNTPTTYLDGSRADPPA